MEGNPEEHIGDVKQVSMEHLMLNMQQIDRIRTILFIVSGIACGILGLTSLNGLLFFLAVTVFTTIAFLLKMKFDVKKYTNSSFFQFVSHGVSSTAMSFVLFWTLSFALVYIY